MKWTKLIAVILSVAVTIPAAVVICYGAWLRFDEWRFYRARPILAAMWRAHIEAKDNGTSSDAASEALQRHLAPGRSRADAMKALEVEGFHCAPSHRRRGAVDCLLGAPADPGYTEWVVGLHVNEAGKLSGSDVMIAGISF